MSPTRLLGLLLALAGLGGTLLTGGMLAESWYARWAWAESGEQQRLARQLDADVPRWLEPDEGTPDPVASAPEPAPLPPPLAAEQARSEVTPLPAATPPAEHPGSSAPAPTAASVPSAATLPDTVAHSGAPTLPSTPAAPRDELTANPGPAAVSPANAPPSVESGQDRPTAERRATAADVAIEGAEFRFLDPPEPGAHARLAVVLRNRADAPSGAVSLLIPARWFEAYGIVGTIPAVIADRAEADGSRAFDFPGLAGGEATTLALHVTARDEDFTPPDVRLGLFDGGSIGEVRPSTVAPRPRPGPVHAVTVPKLGIRAPVILTVWEPPPFVIGQIRGTSAVSEGNSVLIGHLRGPEGDVFARLAQARIGDDVVAVSRGLDYRFVISESIVLPAGDTAPIRATDTPRLTLMTCTGSWNPFTRDYSHRIWVIAEPPELAEATIRANAERAARAAEASATATASAEAETSATATAVARAEAEQPAAVAVLPRAVAGAPDRATADIAANSVTTLPEASADAGVASDVDGEVASEATGPAAAPAPERPEPVARSSASVERWSFPTSSASLPADAAAVDTAAVDVTTANAAPSDAAPEAIGLRILAPADGSRAPRRLVVKGSSDRPLPAGAHVRLFVRALVDGGRWYAYPAEIVLGRSGEWQVELDLGGPPSVRHEVWVGVVDDAAHAVLEGRLASHRDQPLDDLPDAFRHEASVTLLRQ